VSQIDLLPSIRIAATLALLCAAEASALPRSFVSAASGSDANACTRTAPCRNFAAALVQTDSGGEIVVLDSGGYGSVTIGKSVGIVAPEGVHAAVTVFSGNAITINAGPTDVVVLRGLFLNGLGDALSGVAFNNGKALHVENGVFAGFGGHGLGCGAPGSYIYVKDTTSRENGGSGFLFYSASSVTRVSLDGVHAEKNLGYGVSAYSNAVVTVSRSVAVANFAGFGVSSSSVIDVESCTTTFNQFGVYATSGTMRMAATMITGNDTGIYKGPGASVVSFTNNRLNGNVSNGSFSSTIGLQ
jgi:parallel beta helix pectate lyase-like protein